MPFLLVRPGQCLSTLALLLALAGAGQADVQLDSDHAVVVEVQVSGAVQMAATWRHAVRSAEPGRPGAGCNWEHVSGFTGGGERWGASTETIWVTPGEPTDANFWLRRVINAAPPLPPGPDNGIRVRLSAGGRVWRGDLNTEGYAAEAQAEDHAGRFTLRGLHPAEGGDERIDVTGAWRCPVPPRIEVGTRMERPEAARGMGTVTVVLGAGLAALVVGLLLWWSWSDLVGEVRHEKTGVSRAGRTKSSDPPPAQDGTEPPGGGAHRFSGHARPTTGSSASGTPAGAARTGRIDEGGTGG